MSLREVRTCFEAFCEQRFGVTVTLPLMDEKVAKPCVHFRVRKSYGVSRHLGDQALGEINLEVLIDLPSYVCLHLAIELVQRQCIRGAQTVFQTAARREALCEANQLFAPARLAVQGMVDDGPRLCVQQASRQPLGGVLLRAGTDRKEL